MKDALLIILYDIWCKEKTKNTLLSYKNKLPKSKRTGPTLMGFGLIGLKKGLRGLGTFEVLANHSNATIFCINKL